MLALLLKLLPWSFFVVAVGRLVCWVYFTFVVKEADLSAFGSRSRRAWCLITGATDGIGLGLAQVNRLQCKGLSLIFTRNWLSKSSIYSWLAEMRKSWLQSSKTF